MTNIDYMVVTDDRSNHSFHCDEAGRDEQRCYIVLGNNPAGPTQLFRPVCVSVVDRMQTCRVNSELGRSARASAGIPPRDCVILNAPGISYQT